MSDLRPRAIKKLKEEIERIENYKTTDIEIKQNELFNIVDGKDAALI